MIRRAAGFTPYEIHRVGRSLCTPPPTLQRKIFPWLEPVRRRYAGYSKDDPRYIKPAFFDMLQDFGTVIVQDLAFLHILGDNIFAQQPLLKDAQFNHLKSQLYTMVKVDDLRRENLNNELNRSVEADSKLVGPYRPDSPIITKLNPN